MKHMFLICMFAFFVLDNSHMALCALRKTLVGVTKFVPSGRNSIFQVTLVCILKLTLLKHLNTLNFIVHFCVHGGVWILSLNLIRIKSLP